MKIANKRLKRSIVAIILTIGLFLLVILIIQGNQNDAPPYPESSIISNIHWDIKAVRQYADGSDQWPCTWASDNNVYAGWGDGYGWELKARKYNLGVTAIKNYPPNLDGEDIFKYKEGTGSAKPEALIAIGNKIYLFYTNGRSKDDKDNTAVAVTEDNFNTCRFLEGKFFQYAPDGFRVRGILQQGKGYIDSIDQYVYIYAGMNTDDKFFLARVAEKDILHALKWKWFSGTAEDPKWSMDFEKKRPVFEDPNRYVWHIGVVYYKPVDRIILTKAHYKDQAHRNSHISTSLGIFESKTPWGPWRTVEYIDQFIDKDNKFAYFIPAKFIDGLKFWMVFSGWPEYDNISFIPGKLELFAQ